MKIKDSIKMKPHSKNKLDDFYPSYTYSKGWLSYYIERQYANGYIETIAKVMKFRKGSERIVKAMVKDLEDKKESLPFLEFKA